MARWTMYTCGALSLLLLVVSIVLLVAHTFMDTVERQVKKATVLKNGTEVFDAWVNPPPPIYMQFYFFNVTNPLEVLNGEKPVVDEIGPYTYREYRPKEDVDFLENGTEVSAVNPKTYIFEPDKSVGNPEVDLIRTINIPIVTLMEISKNNQYFKYIKPIIDAVFKTYNEGVFLTRPVHELLWGYKDPVLSMVHAVVPSIDEMFGLFYKMNTTNDGTYVVLSGSKSYLDFAKIVKWQGRSNLTWWTSDSCNMINGTDGTAFHPLIDKEDILYIYPSDLCRSIYAVYETSDNVKGIPVFHFTPSAMVFANVSINPANAGFCVPKGNCLPSGLLNVSMCKQGAPIILSSPHFYQAEKSVISSVVGIQPNKEDHETFMDINPLTGMVIQAAKRMQVNVYVRQIPEYQITSKIQTLYFPVMYLNESVLIDDQSAGKLHLILLEARVVANVPFIIMALGLIFGIVFVVLVCRPSRTREEGTEEDRGPLIRTS